MLHTVTFGIFLALAGTAAAVPVEDITFANLLATTGSQFVLFYHSTDGLHEAAVAKMAAAGDGLATAPGGSDIKWLKVDGDAEANTQEFVGVGC